MTEKVLHRGHMHDVILPSNLIFKCLVKVNNGLCGPLPLGPAFNFVQSLSATD